jgi:hypothetical protein
MLQRYWHGCLAVSDRTKPESRLMRSFLFTALGAFAMMWGTTAINNALNFERWETFDVLALPLGVLLMVFGPFATLAARVKSLEEQLASRGTPMPPPGSSTHGRSD